ncbi:MAG: NADH-quinone oxidoreductase subunit C [Desulfosoma sp.]
MSMEAIAVSPEHVVGACAERKAAGYRFVTMTCVAVDEHMLDVLYHFDKDMELEHLRLRIPKDSCVPSITPVFFAAFLVENEIQDLFGLRFCGLAIDYKHSLYLDEAAPKAPFCKGAVDASPRPGGKPPGDPESSE